ncbi:MAG: hypothetical protein AAB692_05470 [Patescibacteria group bacterium]
MHFSTPAAAMARRMPPSRLSAAMTVVAPRALRACEIASKAGSWSVDALIVTGICAIVFPLCALELCFYPRRISMVMEIIRIAKRARKQQPSS